MQRENTGEIHVVLPLIIPGIFSFVMYSIVGSMFMFIQWLYDASSLFGSVVFLLFLNRTTAWLRFQGTS